MHSFIVLSTCRKPVIKLAIIHFPKGIRIDTCKGVRTNAFASPPFVAPPDSLPPNYTISFIDLALPHEQEQAFLRLVREHQEVENGYHMNTQLSMESAPSADKPKDTVFIRNQGKALRGLNLMSEFIHSLPSADSKEPKKLNLSSREMDIMNLKHTIPIRTGLRYRPFSSYRNR